MFDEVENQERIRRIILLRCLFYKWRSIFQGPTDREDQGKYNVGVVLHFLPFSDSQFSKELFGENPFTFKDFINLFLLELPFIFRALNPFP